MNELNSVGETERKDRVCWSNCKHPEVSQDRPEPAKPNKGRSFKYAVPNTKRYLKLHNGDIYDVDSNTILNRKELLKMLA